VKTLILGIGNSILTDDGVGIIIARELKKLKPPLDADIREVSIAGLSILDELDGYDRAVLIDSIVTGKAEPGTLYRLKRADFNTTNNLSSSHGIDFFTALEMGERYGYKIPRQIDVFAVEIADNTTFGEQLTPHVETKISKILNDIKRSVR
jgi:hydrogenase maturation protease